MYLGMISENCDSKFTVMKNWFIPTVIAFSSLFILPACKSVEQYGVEQQSPFSGSAYESSRRYFRAVGKGQSSNERVAQSKADMNARTQLAAMVDVTIKEVADEYLKDTELTDKSQVMSQFQSFSRQVMNTRIADVRKLDEKTYYKQESNEYTVFSAYEIHKNSMYDMLQEQIEMQAEQNDALRQAMLNVIEEARRQSEA